MMQWFDCGGCCSGSPKWRRHSVRFLVFEKFGMLSGSHAELVLIPALSYVQLYRLAAPELYSPGDDHVVLAISSPPASFLVQCRRISTGAGDDNTWDACTIELVGNRELTASGPPASLFMVTGLPPSTRFAFRVHAADGSSASSRESETISTLSSTEMAWMKRYSRLDGQRRTSSVLIEELESLRREVITLREEYEMSNRNKSQSSMLSVESLPSPLPTPRVAAQSVASVGSDVVRSLVATAVSHQDTATAWELQRLEEQHAVALKMQEARFMDDLMQKDAVIDDLTAQLTALTGRGATGGARRRREYGMLIEDDEDAKDAEICELHDKIDDLKEAVEAEREANAPLRNTVARLTSTNDELVNGIELLKGMNRSHLQVRGVPVVVDGALLVLL